jgi:hypothetical protein
MKSFEQRSPSSHIAIWSESTTSTALRRMKRS